MKLFDNLRKRMVQKLIRPEDGYTYTGMVNGEPIKFYYQEDTGKYLVGMRKETMYYHEPTLTGWSSYASKYLPWGETRNGCDYHQEPKEIDFRSWMYGILDNICSEYFKRLDSISQAELRQFRFDRKLIKGEEPFVLNKKSFCDIIDALKCYWSNLNALEGILNVYFEDNILTEIFDKVIDALEEDLEPEFYDHNMDFGGDAEPLISKWLFDFAAGHNEKAKEGIDGHPLTSVEELYDYLVWKRENNLKKFENTP